MADQVGPHGWAVIGGVSFPITHLTYAGGELVQTAVRHGPLAAGGGDTITIFGPDGVGVSQTDQRTDWKAIYAGDVATLTLKRRITSATSAGPTAYSYSCGG